MQLKNYNLDKNMIIIYGKSAQLFITCGLGTFEVYIFYTASCII